MKDGKCWMTQNLRIQNYNINPTDSDSNSTFSISTSNLSGFYDNNTNSIQLYIDQQYGGYYNWNAPTVTSVKMSSTSPVICGVITTCPNEIDNPSAKLAGERAKIVREKLTTNETIAGTLSLITAPNSAEVIHYWTLKAEFA